LAALLRSVEKVLGWFWVARPWDATVWGNFLGRFSHCFRICWVCWW
jgi:hypothetical protein